jgi:zinc transport system permease protein
MLISNALCAHINTQKTFAKDITMPEFMLFAVLGGVITSIMTAPVGTLMLWRRMAYFGDALAHSTLLGFGISLWLNLDSTPTLIAIALFIAVGISLLHKRKGLGFETLLAIAAHSSLGVGMLIIALLPSARVDLMGYLFGDLLSLTTQDLWLLTAIAALVLAVVIRFWQGFILSSLNEDLAKLAGHRTELLSLLLAVLIAVVVATCVKLIGALLMTALLITPAAIAQRISKTPTQMMLHAIWIGQLGILLGLVLSWYLDTPASPAIVTVLLLGFVVSRIIPTPSKHG